MQKAAIYYPLDFTFRSAVALRLGNAVLQKSLDQPLIALEQLNLALEIDNTAPDLLMLAIISELQLNNVEKAQKRFDQFKQVAKHSYFIQFIAGLHK